MASGDHSAETKRCRDKSLPRQMRSPWRMNYQRYGHVNLDQLRKLKRPLRANALPPEAVDERLTNAANDQALPVKTQSIKSHAIGSCGCRQRSALQWGGRLLLATVAENVSCNDARSLWSQAGHLGRRPLRFLETRQEISRRVRLRRQLVHNFSDTPLVVHQ